MSSDTQADTFDQIADELYGLDAAEFTAARNARAKQVRADDRPLSDQIKALKKPTAAAWLANQLVRSHPDEVEALLDLGRELREVMAELGADELRELTRQRYRLVSALVQQAKAVARTRGHPASDAVAQGLRTTLEATLSDEASADAVAAGRLSDALDVSGFGVSAEGTPSSRPKPQPETRPDASVTDLDDARKRRQRQRAQHELEIAEKAAKQADSGLHSATRALEAAGERREKAATKVESLRQELDRAGEVLRTIEVEEASAREAASDAERAAQQAAAAVEQAREHLESQ